jgi:hypothetical protein
MALNITLSDLLVAYRKAKIDCYFENGHNTALSFAHYELNLNENLRAFQAKLNSDSLSWVHDPDFVGSYTFLLKNVSRTAVGSRRDHKGKVFYSDFAREWEDAKADVDFRIIGQLSVEFHILSSLWIDKVGYKLEANVSNSSFGCRLRRPNQTKDEFVPAESDETDQYPDELQLGHFRSYGVDYKKWQVKGLDAIKLAIKNGSGIVAATFDLKKFYHRIDPEFLLELEFKELISLKYSYSEERLTRILVEAITFWSEGVGKHYEVPDEFKNNGHCGIPIGLGASKVIANLILIDLDKRMEALRPIFYGRYVDDFFIAIENVWGINSGQELWEFISGKIGDIRVSGNGFLRNSENNPEYRPQYAEKSLLEFGREKERIFIVEGESGEVFVNMILEALTANSSEWKMLPDEEENLDELSKEISSLSSDAEGDMASLRESNGLSVRRQNFIRQLRNFEVLVGLLPNDMWRDALSRFFKLVFQFAFVVDKITVYNKYYPRLLRLAIKADDPELAIDIWNGVENCWRLLESKTEVEQQKKMVEISRRYDISLLVEAVFSSLSISNLRSYNKEWLSFFSLTGYKFSTLQLYRDQLYFADLHSEPFRKFFISQPNEIPSKFKEARYQLQKFSLPLDERLLKYSNRLNFVSHIGRGQLTSVPKAFFFFTRPFTCLEITFLFPEWLTESGQKALNKFLPLFNLPIVEAKIKSLVKSGNEEGIVEVDIPSLNRTMNKTLAVTSFQTENESWDALVTGNNVEPDKSRYNRLFKIVNKVLRYGKEIDYLFFFGTLYSESPTSLHWE